MNTVRSYGVSPHRVVLVHGGPGAYGDLVPLAEQISKYYGTLEPKQTKQTIQELVRELFEVIQDNASGPIYLIGWSWGAWLASIFAAQQPKKVKKLILISSGPFTSPYAQSILSTRLSRLSVDDRTLVKQFSEMNHLLSEKQLKLLGEIFEKCDEYNPIRVTPSRIEFDYHQYVKISKEANALRSSGKLVNYAKQIQCPVIVFHGEYDPHPFEGVKNVLEKEVGDIQFFLLPKCGHKPWQENFAKSKFYSLLEKALDITQE